MRQSRTSGSVGASGGSVAPGATRLDASPSESEVRPRILPLLSVRQVAALLGVCAATVYRMCEQGELEHFRVRNAIRVDPRAVKRFLARARL